MPDNLRKYRSLYSSTANTFGTGSGVTITPGSVVGLPTDTEITLTFDRVTSAGVATPSLNERIIGIISGSNFVTRTSPGSGRGADGTTEQSHTSPVVEMVWNAKDWNDLIDWALAEHNQDGTHADITADSVTTDLVTADAVVTDLITTPDVVTDEVTAKTTNGNLDLKGNGTGTVRKPVSTVAIIVAPTTDIATGDGKFYFTIPPELNGLKLSAVHARVITAGTTGTTDIQLHNVTDAVDILSTKLTIDSGETGSDTATPVVINTDNDDMATNDLIRVDVDAVSTTPPKGLILRLTFGF